MFENNTATRKFNIKANENSTSSAIDATFNFDGWTTADYKEKVLASVTIDVQRKLRSEGESYIRMLKGKLIYTVPRPGTKTTADPVNAAIKAADGDIDALIKALEIEKAKRANQR
jgi:hypothetical protein